MSQRITRWLATALAVALIGSLSMVGLTGCSPKAKAAGEGSETATQTPPPPPSGPAAALAEKGEKLDVVANPPEMMISRMKYQAERKGTVYDVTFEPYGYGPETAGRPSIVVKTGPTIPRDADVGRLAIDRKNCLLILKKGVVVEKGGSYAGVVTVLREGDSMYFLLTEATPQ